MTAIHLMKLAAAAQQHPDWQALGLDTMERVHIAVMSEPFLTMVFAGTKTVESRFALHRIAPYQQVRAGDSVLMKAGPIVGCFEAAWVKNFQLDPLTVSDMRAEYSTAIAGDDAFWESKKDKRYATLIGIKNVARLTPMPIPKSDRRGWVCIKVS